MEKRLIKIKDFTVLIEEGIQQETSTTRIPSEVVGLVYYLDGEVLVDVQTNEKNVLFNKQKGMMSSFYSHGDNVVRQHQNVKRPLKKISIFISRDRLSEFVNKDEILGKDKTLESLINPQDYVVNGLRGSINPLMISTLENIISNPYTGVAEELLLEGQIMTLFANYFSLVHNESKPKVPKPNTEKLHYAKEILLEQMDSPPSLTELANLTGLNTYKLKTGFKDLFGLPVYKYLQKKRLEKAFELIENRNMTIQEVAWYVGYESIGSFSNAFKSKFGRRPTEI